MKKGFTLIEVLAIIVILGIIASIIGVSVSGTLDSSKKKSYQQQVHNIEKAASMWAVENIQLLPSTGTCTISIEDLYSSGYLPNVPKNPVTNGEMSGKVEVYYYAEKNQYTYTYVDYSSAPACN